MAGLIMAAAKVRLHALPRFCNEIIGRTNPVSNNCFISLNNNAAGRISPLKNINIGIDLHSLKDIFKGQAL